MDLVLAKRDRDTMLNNNSIAILYSDLLKCTGLIGIDSAFARTRQRSSQLRFDIEVNKACTVTALGTWWHLESGKCGTLRKLRHDSRLELSKRGLLIQFNCDGWIRLLSAALVSHEYLHELLSPEKHFPSPRLFLK